MSHSTAIQKLRLALIALKHASHDQSTHGRRGGGGGGGVGAVIAKRNTPISPDQTNMFDALTQPATPAPTPTPVVQQTPTPAKQNGFPARRAPNEQAIAAHEAEIIKQMPLDKLVTPTQRAAYEKLARRVAEFADENDAIREQYLYTTGPDGKLQYDESKPGRRYELTKIFEERGKQIHSEIVPIAESLSFGDLAFPFDKWERLSIAEKPAMSQLGSVVGATMLRESMRVRQPGGNTPFSVVQPRTPVSDDADVKILDKAVDQINKTVKDYVFTPSADENKPVYLFPNKEPGSMYLGYYKSPQPYVQQTVDKSADIPIDTAGIVLMTTTNALLAATGKQKTVSTVAIHEYGHHLETKPGARMFVENWIRTQAGNAAVDAELGSTYAAVEAESGPTTSQWGTTIRGIKTNNPYQKNIYGRAITPQDTDKGIIITGSELTSVSLEKFHAPFMSKQNTIDGFFDRQSAYLQIKGYPDLFGALYAVTQS